MGEDELADAGGSELEKLELVSTGDTISSSDEDLEASLLPECFFSSRLMS